jgi:C-terminal processing protease CtpA/Prc
VTNSSETSHRNIDVFRRFVPRAAIVLLTTMAACGGGGGGGGFQSGVFLDAATFIARCESPRSGTDPFTGGPFPDVQGTTTDENNFLRSHSNNTYLWYDEITDVDPSLNDNPLDYFALLRTGAKTSSGQDKDKFHFTYDSDDWYQLSQSGVSSGYGLNWALLSSVPPRDIIIAYTQPNSPATNLATPLARGAQVLAVDGVDINVGTQAGVDTLNAGLFPSAIGETHTFTVLDLGSQTSRDVTMTSASITSAPVQDAQVLTTLTGNVGYMVFNDHIATAEQALIDAVNLFRNHDNGQGIDDLVIDIRYNGGGFLAIASELAYMIAGPVPTAGRTFEELQFNDKHPTTNPVTGQSLSPTPFYAQTLGPPFNATPGQALPTLNLPRVFVLTGPGTCSASEAVMNGLRGVDVEVIQIGSTTCGKPYGFYPAHNCGTSYFTIQFRGVNDMNFGDYTDGFSPANTAADQAGSVIPGCSVADDFTKQLGDPTESRLSVALAYRDGQACPSANGLAPSILGKAAIQLNAVDGVVPKSPWHTNRILRQ